MAPPNQPTPHTRWLYAELGKLIRSCCQKSLGAEIRSLVIDTHASSCYFRTSVEGDGRKALIQITERCNLHCAHCFVSSGDWGGHMTRHDIADKVLPRLLLARVERVTLTGGEPFAHPDLLAICDDVLALGYNAHVAVPAMSVYLEDGPGRRHA